MNAMGIITQSELDRFTVCPYCMSKPRSSIGCCGESSMHFEEAVEIDGEIFLVSEIEEETEPAAQNESAQNQEKQNA